MDDLDSDPEYSDFDFSSPLSSSQVRLQRKQSSLDPRLYSQHPPAAAHQTAGVLASEHAALLAHVEGLGGGYGVATGSAGGVSEGARKLITRKISRVFQSKAYDYDANRSSLAAVGSGERVWYDSPFFPGHERLQCWGNIVLW